MGHFFVLGHGFSIRGENKGYWDRCGTMLWSIFTETLWRNRVLGASVLDLITLLHFANGISYECLQCWHVDVRQFLDIYARALTRSMLS